MPAPPQALRGRAAVLAVAAGAAVSAASAGSVLGAGAGHVAEATEAGDIALLANGEAAPAPAEPAPSAPATATPSQPAPVAAAPDVVEDVRSTIVSTLHAGTEINAQREIAEEQARRPKVMLPAVGAYTSPYAMRWGVFHGGIDIANAVGTPIVSATDGVVVDAGPAQGFGNWVRVMADDGTMTVYGHMETIDVSVGQRVIAGQKIAGMGSRGFSTGSHLHFEVHINGGKDRIDPAAWLAQHGIGLGGGSDSGASLS